VSEKNQQTTPFLCTDHLVTGEVFELVFNTEKDMLITTPQPNLDQLPSYYNSQDYISHTNAKKSFFDIVYQAVKKIQINTKTKNLERLFPNKGVLLDIGSGTGDFVFRCQQLGWNATAIEPNQTARNRGKAKGVSYIESTKKIKDNAIDCITLWHVLEHLPDLKESLKEIHRVLSFNGKVVLAVPNFLSWDANHYQSSWAAYDVPRHLWHFSPKAIERIFSEAGFVLEKKSPMLWDAFYISMLSEKIQKRKTGFLFGLLNGFRSNWHARRTGMYSSLRYELKKRTESS